MCYHGAAPRQAIYVGTIHLLLGPLGKGEGTVAGVLASLDVTVDKVRKESVYPTRTLLLSDLPWAVSLS